MEKFKENKELLIKILKAINPYRNLAEWFLTIVENSNDENLINTILIEIQNWIKSIKSQRNREKIEKEIKEIYEENNIKTKEDKENADKFLDNFIKNI
jgi:small-conductance mechanosensitive channel